MLAFTGLLASCHGDDVIGNGTLTSIEVGPPNASVAIGSTQQFTATGIYSNGAKVDISGSVTWFSGTPGTATITSAGLASGVGDGTTSIQASSGNVFGATVLTVTGAKLVSIGITPAAPSIVFGTMQQFVAIGSYSDNTTQDLSTQVTWSSATPATATISNSAGTNGLATSVAPGTTAIAASLQGVTSPAVTLTVTAATLVSIGVTPAAPTVTKGTAVQFVATGTYNNNTTQDISTQVTWVSATGTVATINSAGLAATVGTGTSAITATVGTVVSPAVTLTVTPATLVSIGVTPAAPSIAKGTTQQFVAMGTYSDNTTQNITTTVTWASGTPAVASISNAIGSDGLSHGLTVGTTAITAALGGVTSPAVTLTVTAAGVVSIAVTPAAPSVAKGTAQQFVATATYTDATTAVVTTAVTWTSGTPATATISNTTGTNGMATTLAVGTTAITAAQGTVTSPAVTLTVTPAALVSIAVTPAAPSIAKGTNQQFVATGTYTDNSTQDLSTTATWASATPASATISNAVGTKGLAHGVAIGTSVITAALGGVTSPGDTLTVTAAALVSIAVTPTAPSIMNGQTQQFVATGTYTDNSTQVITTTVTWASATTATATISNAAGTNGLATSLAVGTTSITAALGTITSTGVTLTVTHAEYVYATDFNNGLVLEYFVGNGGSLVPIAGNATIATDVNPTGLAVDPTHHFLYVANAFSGTVTEYSIGTTGALTSLGASIATGAGANAVTIDAAGTHAYVPNSGQGADTISQFNLNPTTGALTPMTPATVQAGSGAAVLAINPLHPFAYVVNYYDNTISTYSVTAGALTLLSTTTANATNTGPNSVVIDPTGSFLYVANTTGTPSIAQFSINGTTGALTPLATPQNGYNAHSLTVLSTLASGNYLYGVNNDVHTPNVAQFTLTGTGNLGAPTRTRNVAAGLGPISIAFDPSSQYAYAANETAGSLSQFTVAASGALTLQATPTVPAGSAAGSTPVYITTTTAY